MSETEEEKDGGSSERIAMQAPAIRLSLLSCLPFLLFTRSGKSCFLRSCHALPELAKCGCFPKSNCKNTSTGSSARVVSARTEKCLTMKEDRFLIFLRGGHDVEQAERVAPTGIHSFTATSLTPEGL